MVKVIDEASPLWQCVLNMTLAAYLCDKPDKQIKRMARKYRKKFPADNTAAQGVFDTLISAPQPAKVCKIAYDEFSK
jgi:hypothetical protein